MSKKSTVDHPVEANRKRPPPSEILAVAFLGIPVVGSSPWRCLCNASDESEQRTGTLAQSPAECRPCRHGFRHGPYSSSANGLLGLRVGALHRAATDCSMGLRKPWAQPGEIWCRPRCGDCLDRHGVGGREGWW